MSLNAFSLSVPSTQPGGLLRPGLILGALFLGTIFGVSLQGRAQSGAETITGPDGNVFFQVKEGGGLWAPGAFGAGILAAEGPGTRLLWHPGTAAFRAGRVGFGLSEGTEWNAASMGDYSAAFGVNTTASGRGAAAFGQGTTAAGAQSVAWGYRTSAQGLRAVALGDNTAAPGNFSAALGLNTTARTYGAVALGRWNTTAGSPTDWRPTEPLLVAGNGSDPSDRSNALLLRKNGDLTIAGTLTEHSDRRLKTNIQSLGAVSDALGQIRPVRFRFETGTGHPTTPQIGLLAQDVRAAFPSLVTEGEEGLYSLAYSRLTAVLLKGLQEQRARVDSLQRRLSQVERLARQQKELTEQVAELKQLRDTKSGAEGGLMGGRTPTGLVFLIVGGVAGLALGRRW